MERVAHQLRLRELTTSSHQLAGMGAWVLGFALALYLALNNGGYDVAERSELGVIIWCGIAVSAAFGGLIVLPRSVAAKALLALFAVLAAWTAASFEWTGSAERTAIEVARIATYASFLLLGFAVGAKGHWRALLSGLTCAIGIVLTVAVLSRLEPTLFPERLSAQFLGIEDINRRLAYPLNYSSALGALAGMAVPLLLASSSSARFLLARCVSAAALPLAFLVIWLTASGLSILILSVALVAFFLLTSDRLPKIATGLMAGVGGVILSSAVVQREALDQGLTTQAALQQGDEVFRFVVVVCLGVGLLQAAIALLERHSARPAWMVPSRGTTMRLTAGAAVIGVAAGLAFGMPAEISQAVEDFKSRTSQAADGSSRGAEILELSGSGRYQLWQAAADAGSENPVLGIGAGTYEYWWASNGSYGGFVRDAHSLYLESFAELGVIGLGLIGSIVGLVLAVGLRRVTQSAGESRAMIAGATAAATAFAAAAAFDWLWELSVLPAIFILLAAAIASANPRMPAAEQSPLLVKNVVLRVGLAAACAVPIFAVAAPLVGVRELESSRANVEAGDLGGALKDARDAQSIQPYAASPRLQEALVLELQGRFNEAVIAASGATRREPDNWRNWLILSRLEARSGNASESVDAYRRARSLNPLSTIFSSE